MRLKFDQSKIYKTIMLKGDYFPSLSEFLDDLFCQDLIIDGQTASPIIKNDFAGEDKSKKAEVLLKCIPNEWMDKNEYYSPDENGLKKMNSLITYLYSVLKGNTGNYSLGNSIIRRFLLDASKTKRTLEEHLRKFLSSSEITVNNEMLKKYLEHIIWCAQSSNNKAGFELNIKREDVKLPSNLTAFAGEGEYNGYVIDKMKTLLDNGRLVQLLAGFMLSFIIITNAKKVPKTSNLCSMLIWYDSDELAKLYLWKSDSFKGCQGKQKDVLYSYAASFFENKKVDLSYKIIDELKDSDSPNVPLKMKKLLYAKHLLLGRGCDKNVEEAYKILKGIYNVSLSETETAEDDGHSFLTLEKEERIKVLQTVDKEIRKLIREIIDGRHGEIAISDSDKIDIISKDAKDKMKEENVLDYLPECYQKVALKAFDFSNGAFASSCRVINGNSKEALAFEMSLKDAHKTVAFSNEQDLGSAVKTAQNKKKVDFLMFSDDKDKNLEDCLDLINRLSVLNDADAVSEYIDIYVKADFEYASMMVDSALNMTDSCFRIHICDYNKMSAQKLLTDAPLFIPCLSDDSKANVVVFGTNDSTLALAKEIVAIAYTKDIPNVAFLGDNAEHFKHKLEQEASGIFKESASLNRIVPRFHNCNIETMDFIELLSADCTKPEMLQVCDELREGTYFIVDLGTDEDNIKFATGLRGWLLSCDYKFSRTPFIAVKCESGRTANIARHLVVNNKKPGNAFYNNYNLYFYGTRESVFSSDYLDVHKNPIRQLGLNIHLAYWGDNISDEDRVSALKSYYRFSYNRDSSECTAISLAYMLNYFNFIKKFEDIKYNPQKMAEKYRKWLTEDSDNVDKAARFEHARWAGFLLSRGWRSATFEQVVAYSGQSSGSDHKHLLCKLHPFLCNWNDFSGDSEENAKIKTLQGAINDLRLPVDITRGIVSSIDKILIRNPFEKIVNVKEK